MVLLLFIHTRTSGSIEPARYPTYLPIYVHGHPDLHVPVFPSLERYVPYPRVLPTPNSYYVLVKIDAHVGT